MGGGLSLHHVVALASFPHKHTPPFTEGTHIHRSSHIHTHSCWYFSIWWTLEQPRRGDCKNLGESAVCWQLHRGAFIWKICRDAWTDWFSDRRLVIRIPLFLSRLSRLLSGTHWWNLCTGTKQQWKTETCVLPQLPTTTPHSLPFTDHVGNKHKVGCACIIFVCRLLVSVHLFAYFVCIPSVVWTDVFVSFIRLGICFLLPLEPGAWLQRLLSKKTIGNFRGIPCQCGCQGAQAYRPLHCKHVWQ